MGKKWWQWKAVNIFFYRWVKILDLEIAGNKIFLPISNPAYNHRLQEIRSKSLNHICYINYNVRFKLPL